MWHRERGKRVGRLAALFLIIAGCLFLGRVVVETTRPVVKRAYPPTCGTNLSGLGKAMQIYAADFNDSLPPGDRWCDLLIACCEVPPRILVCPKSHVTDGQSSYAMNANIAGWKQDRLPRDVVLLFESKPGWNQVGGPELLSTENHKGKGCYVVFADGHVEFVERDQLAKLRWDPN